MRILNSFSLTLLVFMLIIQTSWTNDLPRTIVQIPINENFWSNPATGASSLLSRNPKQFDERISNHIAENVLNFGHSIGLQLANLDPYASNSEIFSPLSVMSALSLLMLGAKGKSYQELKQLNGLNSDIDLANHPSKFHEEFGLMLNDLQYLNGNSAGLSKRQNAFWRNTHVKSAPMRSTSRTQPEVKHVIKVANGIFVQSGYTLNPDYSQVIKSIYQSELTQLNFQARSTEARDHINAWVNRSTFGKIPQIITGEIEKSTNVILASVLYFKGFWENPFFPRSTGEDNFYPDGLNSPPIKVQMMPTGGIFPFYDAKEYDCRIIGLPYKGNSTTMYVIQPNNSTRQRLRALQTILDGRIINQMIDKMERKTTVMVFPKMHFTRSMTMKTMLQNLGIQDIFISSYSDLSLIGGRPTTDHVASQAAAPGALFSPGNSGLLFESIFRKAPTQLKPTFVDSDGEPALVFTSRFGEIDETSNDTQIANNDKDTRTTTDSPNTVTGKTESQNKEKRQVTKLHLLTPISNDALAHLESDRLRPDQYRSNLYVDDIIHKVDFAVDEQGTEAAAATLTYLTRSGTDVVFRGDTPFLIVIRHDPTKLPLFYGIINKPEL